MTDGSRILILDSPGVARTDDQSLDLRPNMRELHQELDFLYAWCARIDMGLERIKRRRQQPTMSDDDPFVKRIVQETGRNVALVPSPMSQDNDTWFMDVATNELFCKQHVYISPTGGQITEWRRVKVRFDDINRRQITGKLAFYYDFNTI